MAAALALGASLADTVCARASTGSLFIYFGAHYLLTGWLK